MLNRCPLRNLLRNTLYKPNQLKKQSGNCHSVFLFKPYNQEFYPKYYIKFIYWYIKFIENNTYIWYNKQNQYKNRQVNSNGQTFGNTAQTPLQNT